MDEVLEALTDPQCHLPVATPPDVTAADGAVLPPDSLWRLLQRAPHLAPRAPRPRARELDE